MLVTQHADAEVQSKPHRVVVIGASAGGVETLRRVVQDLPSDLAATICVVLHLAPGSPSALASILRRAGSLPCHTAVDGQELRIGEILVAPPDRHLAITDSRVALTVEPRENGHRPSVDVLFRSAAAAENGHVIGVVLSGTRDDGTAGLAVIKSRGGVAIVQDPDDALYPGMPASAIAHVAVDHVVPSAKLAETIVAMVNDPGSDPPPAPEAGPLPGPAFVTSCPECGGVLSEERMANVTQWRCKVGHRYSQESLASAQAEQVEAAMWAAIRALEDRQALLGRIALQLESGGQTRSAASFRRRADTAARQASVVRSTLSDAAASTLQPVADNHEIQHAKAEGTRQ